MWVGEVLGHCVLEFRFHVFGEDLLVSLDGQEVIGVRVDDGLCDFTLASHGVDGYDATLEIQFAHEFGNGRDLVGLLVDRDLAQGEGRLAGHALTTLTQSPAAPYNFQYPSRKNAGNPMGV